MNEERKVMAVSSEKLRARHVRAAGRAEWNCANNNEQEFPQRFHVLAVGRETVSQRPRRDAPKSSGTFLPGTRNDVGGCIK